MSDHVDMTCGTCGVAFCMPQALYNQRRKDHQTFYCPNGHRRYFPGQTDEEKRIEELERRVRFLRESENDLHSLWKEALEEFATCPIRTCPQHLRRYTYISQQGLFRHLHRAHGITIEGTEPPALEAAG